MNLDKHAVDTVFSLLRTHWPTLEQEPKNERVRVLNRIQAILEKEGLAALTPERIQGLREIWAQLIFIRPQVLTGQSAGLPDIFIFRPTYRHVDAEGHGATQHYRHFSRQRLAPATTSTHPSHSRATSSPGLFRLSHRG